MPMHLIALPLDEPKTSETEVAEENLMVMLQPSAGKTASVEPYANNNIRRHLNGESITLVSLSNRDNLSQSDVDRIADHIAKKYNPVNTPEIYIIAPLAYVNRPGAFTSIARFQDALAAALEARGFNSIHTLTLPKNLSSKLEYKTENNQFTITSTQNTNEEVVLNNSSNYTEQMKLPEAAISESASLLDSDPLPSSGWYEWVIQYLPWVAPVFGADNLNAMKDNEKKFNSLMKEYSSFVDQTCTFNGSNKTLREVFTEQSLRKPTMLLGNVVRSFNTSAWKWLLAPLDETASTDARFIDVLKEDQTYLSKSTELATLNESGSKLKYPDVLAKRTELQQNIKPLLAERDQINIELIKNLTKYESSSQNDSKKAVVGALIKYVKDPSKANWAAVTSATEENKGWDAGLTSRVRRMHDRLKEVHEESIKPESSKPKP